MRNETSLQARVRTKYTIPTGNAARESDLRKRNTLVLVSQMYRMYKDPKSQDTRLASAPCSHPAAYIEDKTVM